MFQTKKPTEGAKLVTDNQHCFSCFNANLSFRQCQHIRKCSKEVCGSTHNTCLHGADRIFLNENQATKQRTPETSTCVEATKMHEQTENAQAYPPSWVFWRLRESNCILQPPLKTFRRYAIQHVAIRGFLRDWQID